MFKKGDRVTGVNAFFARGGEPNKAMGMAPAYEKHLGKVGIVQRDNGGSGCVVLFDDGSVMQGYGWRYKLAEEWVLAPKGHKFKVGDELKIGELIGEEALDDRVGIIGRMRNYVGAITTVAQVHYKGRLSLDCDACAYIWNPMWMYIRNGGVARAPEAAFKKGDKVVVAKNAITKDGPKWIEEQDACLNEEGEVVAVDKNAYQVKTASGEWWYCAEALVEVKKFLRDGGKLKVDEAAIKAKIDELEEKFLIKARKWNGNYGICAFALFVKDRQGRLEMVNCIGHPCHASLRVYRQEEDGKEIVGAIDFPYFNAAKNNPDWDMFADYIINRSSFKIAFHPRDIEQVKTDGIRLNVEATADQVAAGCIALRHGTEWEAHAKQFANLVRQGMDEDAAWLSAFMVQQSANPDEHHIAQIGGGHQVICGGMPDDVVFKFLRHGFPDLGKKPYKQATEYKVNGGIGYDAYYRAEANNSLSIFRDKHLKGTVTGEGFNQKKTFSNQNVLEFTEVIRQHIEKA